MYTVVGDEHHRSQHISYLAAVAHAQMGSYSLRFHSARNAGIASAVLATAIQSVRLSVCLSVTRRYCVKTTARSTVQFAPLDSKNVSSFVEAKKYSARRTPSP